MVYIELNKISLYCVCGVQGEEYKLMWKETVDFVRMASRLNAIIVPFGILGADDAYAHPLLFLEAH